MSLYKPIDADVIIVGGGIAGLTAAFYLYMKEPTLNVLVFEGSGRIGGRAFSVPMLVGDGTNVSYFDIGREWVCKEQNQLLDLLDTLGISILTNRLHEGSIITEYKHLYLSSSRSSIFKFLSPPEKFQLLKFIAKIESLCRTIKENEDQSCVKKLSNITLEKLIMETGGAQNICDKIANVIGREFIRTDHFVTEVESDSNKVLVTTSDSIFCCYRVIMAVPPGEILNIKFNPPLPEEKITAIENTSTNHVTNFVVTYPRAFWKDADHCGDIYVFDKNYFGGPIDFCYNISKSNKPALAGKIFGGKVTSEKGPSYKDEVLWKLGEYFGKEALKPTDYSEKTWHSKSSQMVCWKVGNDNYINDLRSTDNMVYWAGAETSFEWYGHLAGAVSSGSRVAIEVLYDLRPGLLTTDDMMIICPTRRNRRMAVKECRNPYQSAVGHWKYYMTIAIVTIFVIWRLRKR